MEKMNLQDYYDLLEQHDWYYIFSDDHKVYEKGKSNQDKLVDLAEENGPKFKELYKAFGDHYFSGKPWDTEQKPKPERPGAEV